MYPPAARPVHPDNGGPADGFYRFLPHDTGRLHKGGRKLHCESVTIDDPGPPEAETESAAVWRQGRPKGAAQFIGVEGCHWATRLGSRTEVRSPHLASLGPCEAGPDRLSKVRA